MLGVVNEDHDSAFILKKILKPQTKSTTCNICVIYFKNIFVVFYNIKINKPIYKLYVIRMLANYFKIIITLLML